jgi:hypothetical protein
VDGEETLELLAAAWQFDSQTCNADMNDVGTSLARSRARTGQVMESPASEPGDLAGLSAASATTLVADIGQRLGVPVAVHDGRVFEDGEHERYRAEHAACLDHGH